MSFTSSFDIISVVVPDPKIFLCIPTSTADAAAADPSGIKILYFLLIVILFLIMD